MKTPKIVKVLAKIDGISEEQLIQQALTAYIESNSCVRENLVKAGYKEYDY